MSSDFSEECKGAHQSLDRQPTQPTRKLQIIKRIASCVLWGVVASLLIENTREITALQKSLQDTRKELKDVTETAELQKKAMKKQKHINDVQTKFIVELIEITENQGDRILILETRIGALEAKKK